MAYTQQTTTHPTPAHLHVCWCVDGSARKTPHTPPLRRNRCQYPLARLIEAPWQCKFSAKNLLSNVAIPYPIGFFTSDRFCHSHFNPFSTFRVAWTFNLTAKTHTFHQQIWPSTKSNSSCTTKQKNIYPNKSRLMWRVQLFGTATYRMHIKALQTVWIKRCILISESDITTTKIIQTKTLRADTNKQTRNFNVV